ncbi:MAG: hypothetical protein ABI054_11400 [Planctomycetota bacterium]
MLFALLLLSCAPIAAAQVPAPFHCEAADCKRCGDTGELECTACAKTACNWSGEGKTTARFCSQSTACAVCLGTRRIVCPDCRRGMTAKTSRLRSDAESWIAEMRKVDEVVAVKPLHAESAHFKITWNIKAIDVKGGTTMHGGMHIYLDRLEALYADFLKDLGATDNDFRAKTHVMIWPRAEEQERAAATFTGQSSSTESKSMGKAPVFSIFYDKAHLHEEYELHQAVTHQVAHCLLSNVFDGIWPGNIKGGWLDCGLAHAYEIRYFGNVRHYCYVEQDTLGDFKFGRWEQEVLSGLQNGKELRFLGVTGKNTSEMTFEEHMYAWSYVDFLLHEHATKFGAIAMAVKGRQPYAEVLQRVLGLTPGQFQENWATWVKTTYSPKKKGR